MSRWQRVLSLVLCLSVTLCSVTRPVLAADVSEVVVSEQPEAMSYAVMPTSAAAGVLTWGSTGGGAIAIGSGITSAGAAALIPYFVAGGVIILGVAALCQTANELYSMCSPSLRAELDSIDWSLPTFSFSAAAAAELQELCTEYFFDAEGNLKSAGVELDTSQMLQYTDFSYNQNTAPNLSVDSWALGSGLSAIGSTGISAAIVDSPFADSDIALKLHNSKTGKSLTFYNSSVRLLNACEYSTHTISLPMFNTNYIGDVNFLTTGFWVFSHCSNDDCTKHYRYYSTWIGDSNSSASNENMLWTGVDYYSGLIFTGQNFDLTTMMWHRYLEQAFNGADYIDNRNSAFVDICATAPIAQTLVEALEFPVADEVLFLPTADVRANVNVLTPEYVRTGETDTTVPDVGTGTDTSGFWATLWGWLQKLLDAIVGLPATIWGLFKTGFDNIVNAITNIATNLLTWIKEGVIEALKAVFIPRDGFFDNYFKQLKETFSDRFGILTYPITLIYDFLDAFAGVGDDEPVIRWNSWSYQGTEFIAEGSVNLNDFLDTPILKRIHDIYYVVTDAFLIFAFVKFLERKYKSVIMH